MAKREGTMTDNQRVEALLKRQKPDRVPIWPWCNFGIATLHYGATIADAYNKPEVSLAAQRKTCRDFGWVCTPFIAYAEWGGWEFGGDIKWPAGKFDQAPSVVRYPVQTLDDIWKLKVPEPVQNFGIVPYQTELHKLASKERFDNEPFNVSFLIGWPFTIGGNLCGVQNLVKWVLKEPKAVHHLMQLTSDYNIKIAQYWRDNFGVDRVLPITGEASASNAMLSPKQFEEFVMPYLKQINKKVLAMGFKHMWCHMCGDHNLNLPYWTQIPLGDPALISVAHEVDLETAAKYFPNDIIVGNLEPSIVQVKTPEEVYEATKKVVEKGKKIPGGYIFSLGCEFPPPCPPENVMAVTKAINDFGWYE